MYKKQLGRPVDKNRGGSGQLLDLLYPEARFKRVKEVHQAVLADTYPLDIIHRVTMFLTFQCNLRCYYCKTIEKGAGQQGRKGAVTYSIARFLEILEPLIKRNIQHLHLTGGEVTLVKDLPQMIQYATGQGIPCSITTNGTAPATLYENLVNSGLREIRISLDTIDAGRFDKNVGKKGAFKRVLSTIEALVRLRDIEKKPIYLILNVCVGSSDFKTLPETIKSLIRMAPDDIKLIGISQERAGFHNTGDTLKIVRDIEGYIDRAGNTPFSLLRKKLKTIFSSDTYGINDLASKCLMKRCFVPLTEWTIDAKYYYPCPVYLREGGQPIGTLDEDIRIREKKIRQFVENNSCLDDSVCLDSCIYCTKVFNNHMNAAVFRTVRKKTGSLEPVTHEIRYENPIRLDTIVSRMTAIEKERSGFDKKLPCPPFIALKPSGMCYETRILKLLTENGIVVKDETPIADWNRTAEHIYTTPATMWNVYRGVLYQKVLPLVEGRSDGKLWLLRGNFSHQDLKAVKALIRKQLPPLNYVIHHQDEVFVTSPGYLHTPDQDSHWMEWQVLSKEYS